MSRNKINKISKKTVKSLFLVLFEKIAALFSFTFFVFSFSFLSGCTKAHLPTNDTYEVKQVQDNNLNRAYILKKYVKYTKINNMEETCSTENQKS